VGFDSLTSEHILTMGSSESENFCLRWNDFEANVSGAFRDLRAESDFFDVTLGCSDSSGRSLQAHKVILSACSSFFKGMLRQQAQSNPAHPNPYIYLRGVSYADLSSVLDFMYHGEVNVLQEDLNSFLAVAEELQIKGLTNKEGEASKGASGAKPAARSRPSSQGGPPVKRRKPSPTPQSSTSAQASASGGPSGADHDVKSVVDIKSDPEAGPSASGGQAVSDSFADDTGDYGEDSYGGDYGEYDNGGEGGDNFGDVSVEGGEEAAGGKGFYEFEALMPLEEALVDLPDGRCRCRLCNSILNKRATAKRHYIVNHTPLRRMLCSLCGAIVKNKYALNSHLNLKHQLKGKELVRCYGEYINE